MTDQNKPCTETQMRIRKPADEVFNAFINPEITTNFWFTKSSGKLEAGKNVQWDWEMYNVSAIAYVKEIVKDEKIVIEWGQLARKVEFTFKSLSDNTTYVVIKESGYVETGNDLINVIKDSTGGFTTVLDGMKAYLEFGIKLNLIADKYPKEVIAHGK
jgi:uncharacterized protein YndB with AHSA1/START domain